MNIIIIGAGIGGLCSGIALKRLGHNVRIFEQVTEIKPVGAAISVWSNGVKCLNYLGLNSEVAAVGGTLETMAYIDGLTGKTMTSFSLKPLIDKVGERPYPISRADLQSMLMNEFGIENVSFGKRIEVIHDNCDQVSARFSDGSLATGDLLIGADGTHSVVRSYVLGEKPERRYAGYVNWNGLVEIDEALAPSERWTTFVAEGKRVSLMPVSGNRFYFFFDVPLPQGLPNERSGYRDNLKTYFSGWAAPVQALIERVDVATTNRVEIFDLDPLTQWVRGRVALLGDAAHSTTPDLGQGGCMAMEDAVSLAQVLQTHSLGLDDSLHRYQNRRVGRAKDLVLRARRRCDITHAVDAAETAKWYEELRVETGVNIIRGIASNIEGGPFG